jgi:hypothetical protein
MHRPEGSKIKAPDRLTGLERYKISIYDVVTNLGDQI